MLYSAFTLSMSVYNYYHPDFADVPVAMVDLIKTDEGDRYIKYDAVFEAETNDKGVYTPADLNAYEGKNWIALYSTTSYEAGKAILADEFAVSNSNNKPKDGYSPVHRFGEVVCYNLNKYTYEDDTDIYLSFKRTEDDKSAVADVPTVVGSVFGTGFLFLAGGIGTVVGIGATLATQGIVKKKKSKKSSEPLATDSENI